MSDPLKKYIVCWNTGFGETCVIMEFTCLDTAEHCAYELWNEEAQSRADYCAMPYTKELAVKLKVEDE